METKIPRYLPSVGRLLAFAARATNSLSERGLREHGLTLPQWVVLSALWRTPGLTESEIGAYARASPSATNRLLDRMVEAGLVRRREDAEDRRRVRVDLGPKGRRLKRLVGFYEEINAVLLRGFSTKETKQVVEYLERITRNAEEALATE